MEDIGTLLKNPHKHPLVLYQFGVPNTNEQGVCSLCQTQWNPPAFRCYGCDYYIHQSCIQIHLPPRIQTPLHRQHSTPLLRHSSNSYCRCCGQKPIGDTYKCPLCDFIVDYQCAIADTRASGLLEVRPGEFRHFTHVHPLTLQQKQQWENRVVVCLVCNLRIQSGSSTYSCSYCDSHLHKHCAELPREIRDSEIHQHALFLFARSFDGDKLCNNCRNHCFKFFYSCTAPLCKFKLHVSCLPSFKHQHNFLQLFKAIPYTCQFCGKKSTACPWFCSICQVFADKQCVELPISLRTFKHDHELNLTFFHGNQDICKICSERIDMSFARYTCDQSSCRFDVHLDCAKLQKKCVQDEELNIDKVSKFAGHEHKLTLCSSKDNVHCNGCMQCIITESYGCIPCEFNLHEDCAGLRRRRIILPLHSHQLNMVYIPDFIFSCSVCHQYCHGFAYYCKQCHYAIDIRCASIAFPLKHPSHCHPLFPLWDGLSMFGHEFGRISESLRSKGKHKCGGCGDVLMNKSVFGCDDCKFYLDAKCANLPLAVRNRFDEHPLALTFENDEDKDEEELYCDVCEEKREINEWFYYCKMCYFAAHLRCALGDYPFLKSAKFEGHRHLLNLVKEGKKGYFNCGACGHSCEGSPAFECERCTCKFNVHAFGLCYHKQLTQGQITFTMPSLYSRSLPLYLDPIERKRSKSIFLGGSGEAWKERGISGIRKFMVDHGRWVDSIQKQYHANKNEIEARGRGSTSKVNNHGIETLNYLKNEENVNCNNVLMSLGEYGGLGGMHWYDEARFSSIIRTVEIIHQNSIISIHTQCDHNGNLHWSPVHGGIPRVGSIKSTVKLDPDEYLISVEGYMDDHEEHDKVIRSLTLESNKKIYGPFGREEGIRFCFPTSGAKIVGFHGRSGNYLHSIGIKVVPISQPQSHCFGVINETPVFWQMEEIGVLKNPHKHPLVLYQFREPNANEKGICSICQTEWNPPAFRCYGCDYYIHQSCIQNHLPPRIQTPLHRQHSTPLLRHRSNSYCRCCGQKPVGDTYKCPLCDFVVDFQCAIADTRASGLTEVRPGEFRHFTHVHPLTLQQQQWENRVVVCLVCNLRIQSGSSTYSCSYCDSHLHKQCAELPREIRDSEIHQHPLFLFSKSFDGDKLCNNCRNHCFKFFYSCTAPLCKFKLHVSCLPSSKHQHNFLQLLKAITYTCQFCGKISTACPWFCNICQVFADKQCVELPISLCTVKHDHELNLTFSHSNQDICKICSESIDMSFARYACDESGCGFDAHLDCAKLQQKCVQDEELDIDKVSKFVGHGHRLTLCSSMDNVHCNGCMQCIITESYGCPLCEFNLHEDCAGLRRQQIILPLHSHQLNMVYIPDFMFSCSVCHQYCHGFAYYCKQCHYAIDIRCAAITFPFKHLSHNHPLFPLWNGLSMFGHEFGRISESLGSKGKHKCRGCGDLLTNKSVFGCDDCKFYLDAKCANLPLAVRNRFDEHPLALTFENDEDEDEEELYCDVCEEKRERNEWFYYCKMCYFAAHLRCALGDYPFVKSAKFEGHRHLLNLVKEGKKGYSNCGACGHSCEGSLAFECEHCTCKFNVHAFGLCYHNQLTLGRITFTMPSLYSRSLPLYLDPIERKRSKSILLGENGGAWKERDFSGIRKFMVDHGRWADSIHKQYDKIEDEDEARAKGRGSTSKVNKHEIESLNYLKNEKNFNCNNVLMSLGEYGGLGGMHWYDEATFSSIIQKVEIVYQNSIISIRTQYDHNGNLHWSPIHGGNLRVSNNKHTVKLESDEFLISVEGYMSDYGKHNKVIRSLTLESNKKIYGPFGREEGTRFCFPTSGAKVVGFHGRSGNYLDSIGIKVVPISQPQSHALES